MFFILSIFDTNIEIKCDAETVEEARSLLEQHAVNYVRETSGAERAQSPFQEANCNKDTLTDGAYLIRVNDNQIDVYNKKTTISRGWTYNTIDYKILPMGSYKVLQFDSQRVKETPVPENIVIPETIKVQFCENCANRVKHEPIVHRKIKTDDGILTSIIEELKKNRIYLLRRKTLI